MDKRLQGATGILPVIFPLVVGLIIRFAYKGDQVMAAQAVAAAAGPNAANTPAPIMEPSPMTTASLRPSRRCMRGCSLMGPSCRSQVNARRRNPGRSRRSAAPNGVHRR